MIRGDRAVVGLNTSSRTKGRGHRLRTCEGRKPCRLAFLDPMARSGPVVFQNGISFSTRADAIGYGPPALFRGTHQESTASHLLACGNGHQVHTCVQGMSQLKRGAQDPVLNGYGGSEDPPAQCVVDVHVGQCFFHREVVDHEIDRTTIIRVGVETQVR